MVAGFGNIDRKLKKLIRSKIPTSFCVIKKLSLLNNTNLVVEKIIDENNIILNIFDENNRIVNSIVAPLELKNKEFKIVGDIFSTINSQDDKVFYREYKISR